MAIEDYIPKTSGLFQNLGDFELPSVPGMPDLGLPTGLGDIGGFINNPICDENLFKDIDGMLSLGSLPSIPNLESVLSNAISDIPIPNPDVMFSGIPEFTGMIDLPGLPEVDLDCIEGLLGIDGILDDLLDKLCGGLDGLGGIGDAIGGIGDAIGDAIGGIGDAIPDIPSINIPDIPCVGDLGANLGLPDLGDLGLPDIGNLGLPDIGNLDIPDIPDIPNISDLF